VSAVDAFGPDIDPRARVVRRNAHLAGHRGGDRLQLRARRTEVALFDPFTCGRAALSLDPPPALERLLLLAQLREQAYRQQARLLHAALSQPRGAPIPSRSFPRRVDGPGIQAHRAGCRASIAPTRALDPSQGIALHSVSICDLAQRDLAAEAPRSRPAGRVFVSPESVFVWAANSSLFRIPDGGAPSALRVRAARRSTSSPSSRSDGS
jgi:hypothetical protein